MWFWHCSGYSPITVSGISILHCWWLQTGAAATLEVVKENHISSFLACNLWIFSRSFRFPPAISSLYSTPSQHMQWRTITRTPSHHHQPQKCTTSDTFTVRGETLGTPPIKLLQEYYKRDTSHRCGSFVHPLSFCTHSYHTLAPIKLFILLFRRRSALVSESDVVQLHLHLSCILLHLDSISVI